jgi:2,5-diamino-6-(ribosylamino)-4(3H)-pyrimidinone 5'-phosphate reductase
MLPRVIMFNTISMDGALRDFEIDIGLHYRIAGRYRADVHLIGSETARTGIEMFSENVPKEEPSDFVKPEIKRGENRPYWAVIDSRGILMNLLHMLRRSEFGKDVIVFISENTPDEYKHYLQERGYDFFVAGKKRVDLKRSLEILAERYDAKTVLVDAGATLNGILLEHCLVDEISLLVSPVLVGRGILKLFGKLDSMETRIECELLGNEVFENSQVLLEYKVIK